MGKNSALWAWLIHVVLVRRLLDSTTSVLLERRAPSDPGRRREAWVPTPLRLSADRLRGTAPVETLPEGAMGDGGLWKRRESGYGGDR